MKVSVAVRMSLAIAGLLMIGAPGWAQGPGGGPGFGEHRPPFERALGPQGDHGHWWNNPRMVEKLKLTDEQRKAMDDILQQHREKLVDLRGSVEKAELELEPLMRDDQPNEAKILAQIDKVAQARAELEKGNARFLLAIRGKLLPEQWKELQAERTDRGQERHGFGAGGYGRQGGRDWKPGAQGPDGQKQGGQGRQAPAPPPGPQGMTNEDPGSDRPGSPAGGDIQ